MGAVPKIITSSELISKTIRCSGQMAIAARAVLNHDDNGIAMLRKAVNDYDNAIVDLHTHSTRRSNMS